MQKPSMQLQRCKRGNWCACGQAGNAGYDGQDLVDRIK